jgi:hypothetical protein
VLVLILLPPSEGKAAPADGEPVDLDALSFPELTDERLDVLSALVRLCRREPGTAAAVLELGPRQTSDVERNAGLPQAPAAPARTVYTGVLFDALGLDDLDDDTARRADSSLAIASALWGLLRPGDSIPAYRLGGGVTLPGIGRLGPVWRPALARVVPAQAADGIVVDVRSSTYSEFWRPAGPVADRTVAVRVLHEREGRRVVVSHFNKATKGRIVRSLLTEHREPASPAELGDLLSALGWKTELSAPSGPGKPWTADVVITEVEIS